MARRLGLYGLAGLLWAAAGCDDTAPLEIRTRVLRDARLERPYGAKIEVMGGTAPYRFALAAGALPAGLELTSESGQVLGVPTTPGDHEFWVRVSDAAAGAAEAALSLHVIPHVLEVATTELPAGKEGSAYEARLEARGGVPPYVWSLTKGGLLGGLDLRSDGRLAGTPLTFGSRPLTFTVEDARGRRASGTLRLEILSLRPLIQRSDLPRGRLHQPYPADTRLPVSGGDAPYAWVLVNGRLPAGMELEPGGLLMGTPEARGVFDFAARVTDAAGLEDEASFALAVAAPLAIETRSLARIPLARPVQLQLAASGGLPPYAWSLAPSGGPLPTGLELSSAGRLSGTTSTPGPYDFTVVVEDSGPAAERAEAQLSGEVGDRLVYRAEPTLSFPPVCTGTTVSYRSVELEVRDSVQILDLDVEVDVEFVDMTAPPEGNLFRLQLLLVAPDGTRVALCGGGAGLAETPGCNALFAEGTRIATRFDTPTRPEQSLATFVGTNPHGTWRLTAVVTHPSSNFRGECRQRGTIHGFGLRILDDPSPDEYVLLGGFTRINLFREPAVRIAGAGRSESELFLAATVYTAGPNGVREAGQGDDAPRAENFGFSSPDCDALGVQLSPDGHVRAGTLTGACRVELRSAAHTLSTRLVVLPPDFNRLNRAF